MFKEGDQVIKKSGGNKMCVVENNNGLITCIWATDKIHLDSFLQEDLMTMKDYECLLIRYDREDKINKIING